jgi:tetratricopeptide (TPR) repeat protein
VCSDKKDYDFSAELICSFEQYFCCVINVDGIFSFHERIEIVHEALAETPKGIFCVEGSLRPSIVCALARAYTDANDINKAKEVLERAYMERSEVVGPDDVHLQRITLQLCQMLAEEGEYDRMLEYLEVAMDGTKWFFDNPGPKAPFVFCHAFGALLTAVASSFRCISYLPVDHVQRRDVYARAFQMMAVCLKACIRDAPRLPSIPLEEVAIYSFSMFEDDIPLDIDFDHEELLRLLVTLYDLYRPYFNQHQSSGGCRQILLTQLQSVLVDMVSIYSYVLEGRIDPASVRQQDLLTSALLRMDDHNVNFDSTTP